MNYLIKYLIIIFLLLTTLTYAQYSKDDRQLAATTFTRNFDKVTCKEYLTSKDDNKVIAGLLSVSHSQDTSFVHFIIDLPIDKFAREICFTLGQLGTSSKSSSYLKKLFYQEDGDPLIKYYALTALGKIGDSSFAKQLVADYKDAKDKSGYNGISTALYYLFTNGRTDAKDAGTVLEQELNYSSSREFEAAFSLYRMGPSAEEKDLIVDKLKKLLNARIVSEITQKPIPYLLACLRKLQYFPDEYDLLVQLRSLKDFPSRVEAVKTSVYYNFKSSEELGNYLLYIKDENNNISREAASSIKNLKLNDDLKKYLNFKLKELLNDTQMEKYTKGELFLSYLSLFPENFNDALSSFTTYGIDNEYRYKACSLFTSSEEAFKFLSDKYSNENSVGKLAIIESLLKFDPSHNETGPILFSALNSNDPGLISTAADGLDSMFISVRKDTIAGSIKSQVENYLNNADYTESLISLEALSGKISADFQKTIAVLLSGSRLYSLKRFTVNSTGGSILSISKDIDNFDELWENAFEYSSAEIITEKGSFVITFLPEYAPVTVGNFCFLAAKGFFDGQIFHRVVPGFVIQGGDPTGTGWGGPGYEIISEFSPLEYNRGVVGMASAGKDTESSQWFVTTGNYPHLNGRYTIFAEVLKGLDVIEKITQEDKILSIKLK